jgi:hypothetical protein
MRFLGAVLLALAALFGVGLITGVHADAATSVAPPPVIAPPGGATLTQQPDGTWTTSVFLDTTALCGDSFDLFTGAPDTDKAATQVTYVDASTIIDASTSTAPCGSGPPAVTEVELTFPAMPDGAIPQTATLAVTPSATALAAGAAPVEFALTVRRQLSGASNLWISVWFGLAFVVLLVILVASIGVNTTDNRRVRGLGRGLLGAMLYAPSAWTFGGGWATNFTALGTVIGGVLTATGAVSGVVPGVDLGRIGLLFAIFGVSAVTAPLVFGTLNARRKGPAPADDAVEVPVTKAWSMLLASSFTAFGMGASIGLIGWVLTYRLVVAPWQVRFWVGAGICVVAGFFLANVCVSIVAMAHGDQSRTVRRAATGITPARSARASTS